MRVLAVGPYAAEAIPYFSTCLMPCIGFNLWGTETALASQYSSLCSLHEHMFKFYLEFKLDKVNHWSLTPYITVLTQQLVLILTFSSFHNPLLWPNPSSWHNKLLWYFSPFAPAMHWLQLMRGRDCLLSLNLTKLIIDHLYLTMLTQQVVVLNYQPNTGN